jgi:hypothetical protein
VTWSSTQGAPLGRSGFTPILSKRADCPARLHVRHSGLKAELATYLDDYKYCGEHHGRITQGRIPADLVYGARKMEPK